MKGLVIFLCLTGSISLQAQFIIAGDHGVKDNFYDVVPDSQISYPHYAQGTYPLDINSDGIIDLEFKVRWAASPGGCGHYCYIQMLNNNEAALSHFDSCFYYNGNYYGGAYYAYSFHENDPIGENTVWSNVRLYMAACNSLTGSYNCGINTFGYNDTSYAGVRVFVDRDTLYGWIKVSNVYSYAFTLLEYACTKPKSEIEKGMVYAYPVPATDNFTVRVDSESLSEIFLFDMAGRKILEQSFVYTVTVDISRLSKGVYFYEVRNSESARRTGKVVKQ
jgi:hypothetical protein